MRHCRQVQKAALRLKSKLEPGDPGRNGGDVDLELCACDHNRLSAGTNGIDRQQPANNVAGTVTPAPMSVYASSVGRRLS